MEVFAIIAIAFGIVGMGLASRAIAKISKLEDRLRESGLLERHYEAG